PFLGHKPVGFSTELRGTQSRTGHGHLGHGLERRGAAGQFAGRTGRRSMGPLSCPRLPGHRLRPGAGGPALVATTVAASIEDGRLRIEDRAAHEVSGCDAAAYYVRGSYDKSSVAATAATVRSTSASV